MEEFEINSNNIKAEKGYVYNIYFCLSTITLYI